MSDSEVDILLESEATSALDAKVEDLQGDLL